MAERIRTFWKGYLQLALVNIPVRMLTATRSDQTFHFHQVDRQTKQRIKYQKVVPGRGVVPPEDIVSGYEVEPGEYVLFEGEELDAIKLETRHTIELTQFVNHCEIEPLYFEKPYYLLPDGDIAAEGYRVIRDALRAQRKVGVGQLTLRGKENLVALQATGAGLMLETLRYEQEVREADQVFADLGEGKLREDMVAMAKMLIEQHSAPFDPNQYKNHYTEALRELVQSKLKTGTVSVDENEDEKPGKVVDFMEALKRSLAARGEAAPAREKKAEPARETLEEPENGKAKTRRAAPNKRASAAKKPAHTPKKRKAG